MLSNLGLKSLSKNSILGALAGFSFSNRVGVEKLKIARDIKKILEKPKDCFAVKIKVAVKGHVHKRRKLHKNLH